MLFNLGKEIKSQPLPSSLQKKLKIINKEKEKSSGGKKSFIFFRIPKIRYAAIAAFFALVFYGVFYTSEVLMVKKIDNGSMLKAMVTLDKFKIIDTTETSPIPNEGMLNIDEFKKTYNNYMSLYNFEIKINEKSSKNKFTNKMKGFLKAAFTTQDSKSIYAKWKDSVFYIANPSGYIADDKIKIGGMGSGSLIDRNGLILTNWHVIENANQVWVYPFPKDASIEIINSDKFLGRVVAKSKKNDLALVQVTGISKRTMPISFTAVNEVVAGEKVFAIGHPEFFTWSVQRGIVNAIRINYEWFYDKPPEEDEEWEHKATMIQNDINISGGNSGGPLFNEKGNMIGINTMTVYGNNISLAVAADHAKELIQNREKPGIKSEAIINPLTEETLKQKYPNLQARDSDNDMITDEWWVDADNNGKVDHLFDDGYDPNTGEVNEDGIIEKIWIDMNENESWETFLEDTDLDGNPDYQRIDRDDDDAIEPKWDAIAVDTDQDGIWDKVQDIPKS